MSDLDTLMDRLKEAPLSPEERELAAKLAIDLVGLLANELGGEDIQAEIAHLRAQAANLSAVAVSNVQAQFSRWITEQGAKLVLAII